MSMLQINDYKLKLEVFEGPLDLLLYLIKKDEVDIYNIPIELITRQYGEYLSLMHMLDLDIAGEFLVMAATLMMIKSRMLLPEEERPTQEVEEEDPRLELIRQLLEYKKFKDAAAHLQDLERRQENIFGRGIKILPCRRINPAHGRGKHFDLISALNDALKRVKPEGRRGVCRALHGADKIEYLLKRIRAERAFFQACSRNGHQ